jgi:hypothetical protein
MKLRHEWGTHVVVERTKSMDKDNRRSFDSPVTRCVTGFAQNDTVCGGMDGHE